MSTVSDNGSTDPRIGALLRAAHKVVYGTVYERTAAAGYPELHPAHFRLLQFPGVDGVRPTELARSLATSKQAINPLLNDLDRWGYITREPGHQDGRGRVIRLTNRGHKLMRTIRSIHAQIESDWAKRLGPRKFQSLRDALDQITQQHPFDNHRLPSAPR
ncbi:MAG: MarR family winged helix-turn-helix transcriptional regulator [Actinomycetota bacterium]|nr:MarR family winged helix-turn-helix transcriptional regulator [Actinomycetota bacterium]